MKSSKTHRYIEKLPQGTIRCLDTQDFMQIINKLLEQKEDLENEMRTKVVEIDTWIQMLGVTTPEEIKELFDSLPNVSQYSQEEVKLLQDYYRISREMNAHSLLSNCRAMSNEDGDIILKFSSTAPSTFRNLLVWITTTEDSEYMVKNHNFPDSIPITKLQEKYFKDIVGTDQVLEKFSTALYQYTWPLYRRLEQITAVMESELLGNTVHPYCNDGLTQITFMMFPMDAEKNRFTFEFVLNYHAEDILPYKVTPKIIDKKKPPQLVKESVNHLALEMQAKAIVEVLHDFIEKPIDQQLSSDSGSSTASTTIFEMF